MNRFSLEQNPHYQQLHSRRVAEGEDSKLDLMFINYLSDKAGIGLNVEEMQIPLEITVEPESQQKYFELLKFVGPVRYIKTAETLVLGIAATLEKMTQLVELDEVKKIEIPQNAV